MPDVFLSYNREDQAKAKLIATALEADGFDVWWDTVLRAGETYDEVTEKRLRDAKSVVVLWSSRSVRSKWVRAEATLGDRKAALIPVMIEACDRPIMFELIQTADLTQWNGDQKDPSWRIFLGDVRAKVERHSEKAAPKVAAPVVVDEPDQTARTDSIETAYWMSVKDGTDPAEFTSYLRRYPQGHFSELAQKRLETLQANAAREAERAAQLLARPVVEPKVEAVVAAPVAIPVASRSSSRGNTALIAALGVMAVAALGAFVYWPREPASPKSDAVTPDVVASGPEVPTAPADVPTAAEPAVVPPKVESPTVEAPTESAAVASPTATATFRDCPECPEMGRLSGGNFMMGSPESERGRRAWEGPQKQVQIAPFAMSLREVSFAEWEACVADGGCKRYLPGDRGWGRGARPVMMVSWNDAQAYVSWLSAHSHRAYRLPSESEWEFAARGGATTSYWWGESFDRARVPSRQTNDTGSLTANGFGLFDVSGNVAEWVQDCYVNDFSRLPTNGSPTTSGDCGRRVVRGGSWRDSERDLRVAYRARLRLSVRDATTGFRVASAP